MKRENFRTTASRAIDEGSRQRQMSAQRLAPDGSPSTSGPPRQGSGPPW